MIWTVLWKTILGITLAGYSLLVIVVVIGGIKNLIDMLQDLKK